MTDNKIEMIKTEGLKKKFIIHEKEELQVLKGIDETIYKGEVVTIIGPSGGGKSTFLRCLNLLETPDEGKIWVEGTEITDRTSSMPTLDSPKWDSISLAISVFISVPMCEAISSVIYTRQTIKIRYGK